MVHSAKLLVLGYLFLVATVAWAADAPVEIASQIVFSSNRSGPWRIWSIRADGSDLQQLTQAGADEQDVDPVLSPDGQSLLFSSTRGGTTGVWRAWSDGSQAARICDGDQAEWSPDGKSIAFRRAEQIQLRDLTSGIERRLSPAD